MHREEEQTGKAVCGIDVAMMWLTTDDEEVTCVNCKRIAERVGMLLDPYTPPHRRLAVAAARAKRATGPPRKTRAGMEYRL